MDKIYNKKLKKSSKLWISRQNNDFYVKVGKSKRDIDLDQLLNL